jgi:hypothetical protein
VRPFLIASSLCAAGAAILGSAALAGQPVPQPLNPPPPPWQTCKAVGDGTICEGTNVESYGPLDTGLVCGSGASAFDIFDAATDEYSVWKKFDTDGNLVRRVFHDHYTFGQFSNPRSGAVVPYTQTDSRIDILAVPGDLGSAVETTTWQSQFHVQAGGAPVFWNSGRTVQFPINGATEFRAGRLDWFELSDGDAAVLGPLCAALGA